ncbi:hypothetical protein H5410_061918 [Solanum commersonii]|uniref:Uncharacterized protein n=1 Tax=Solanum commersonii TaxID=4109 RepID=A0A9J5WAN7_SOLCO|nr:hypothetical protein H5410_061918 [Solanum commersonii]
MAYIKAIKDMYDRPELEQWEDKFTWHIQWNGVVHILFKDEIVLIDEIRSESGSEEQVQVISKKSHPRESFKYLGSIIQGDKKFDKDVAHPICARWLKWWLASAIPCDKNVSTRLNVSSTQWWFTQLCLWGRVSTSRVGEMRMRRWMCIHTRRCMIRNEIM